MVINKIKYNKVYDRVCSHYNIVVQTHLRFEKRENV